MSDTNVTAAQIIAFVRRQRTARAEFDKRLVARRALISRVVGAATEADLGIYVPEPFQKSSLILRTMIGDLSKAIQHYASRLSANTPIPAVTPVVSGEVTRTVEEMSGAQERLLIEMFDLARGRIEQWRCAWAQVGTGAGYYLTLPREVGFGLPDREYFTDRTDDEIAELRRTGKVSHPQVRDGKLVYAESADVWRDRRKEAMRTRAVSASSLFTLRAYPRDMVYVEKDADGVKQAVIIEQVPASDFGPRTQFGRMAARKAGLQGNDIDQYGLITDPSGRIVGGRTMGGPQTQAIATGQQVWTLVTYVNRLELVYLVSRSAAADGAYEIWRGRHGCTVRGVPACPMEEVGCYLTDIEVPGQEFATPLDRLFAIAPLLNQALTLWSAIASYNAIPRFVVELADGSMLRNDAGEIVMVDSQPTPGLDPKQMATYSGKVVQLEVKAATVEKLVADLTERIREYMPTPAASGVAAATTPAWSVQQQIAQSQQDLAQPVGHHAQAWSGIWHRWVGWMRDLDVPLYVSAAPHHRQSRRSVRGLIEFDPKNLTDSFGVQQMQHTQDERVVLEQIGQDKLAKGLISPREYFETYALEQDPEQAERDMYVGRVVQAVVSGQPVGEFMQSIVEAVKGRVQMLLAEQSPAAAIGIARQMAAQARQQAAAAPPGGPPGALPPGAPPDAGGPGPADAAGVHMPGMGMAATLNEQLGPNGPGALHVGLRGRFA